MNEAELDTAIVDAITVFKAAKRGEHMSDNRDELAAMAMAGIAGKKWEYFDKDDCMEIAVIAYQIADAMIACKKGYGNGKPE